VGKRIISALKRVEFFKDRMSYRILQCCWCYIIVLNVHAPTEDKNYGEKDSLHQELESVFDKFPKSHMKMLLYFNAKVSRKESLKHNTGNEILHKICKDNESEQ
jgi:hypothetical protein